jgi:hypothetical protein
MVTSSKIRRKLEAFGIVGGGRKLLLFLPIRSV